MLRLTAGALLILLSPMFSLPARSQEVAPAGQPQKTEFFSGSITVLDADKITVVKTALGITKDTRTFLITKETRIEGTLKLKARVTVRYTQSDEGNRATHIIVRTSPKK